MKDRLLETTQAIEDYGRKLDGIYRVHGREGLSCYSGSDVCVLYWCLQNERDSLTERIESGDGREADLLRKEQLTAQLKDLHTDLIERHDRGREVARAEPEMER